MPRFSRPCLITAASLALTLMVGACAGPAAPDETGLTQDASLRLADAAQQSGDLGLARAMLAKGISAHPHDTTLTLRYADLLAEQGRIDAARDYLMAHAATSREPHRIEAGLAALDLLAGHPERAIARYDMLLRAAPDDPALGTDKAVALDLLGDHAAAQTLYRRLLARNPDDTDIQTDLALSLSLSGRGAEARRIAGPLAERDDVSARTRNTLALVLGHPDGGADSTSARIAASLARLGQVAPGAPRED